MSAVATYALYIDLDGDRDLTDISENLTAYLMSVNEIWHGMTRPGDHVARSASLRLTMDNTGGQFSPQGASALSGLERGKLIKLTMTYSGTTVTLYQGRVDHIRPMPGTRGPRTAEIACDGYLARLMKDEVAVEPLQETTSEAMVAAILLASKEYPPQTTGWFLGVSGFSELGNTTTLGPEVTGWASIEAGANSYPFAGDNWREKTSPYRALLDVVNSEQGWLYEQRDGTPTFWGRHHLAKDMPNAVDATLTGASLAGAEYKHGESLVNRAQISFNPRRLGPMGATLGQSDEVIAVPKNGSTVVTIRYDDGSGNRISGINLINPVPTVDYTATPGTLDVTKYVTVRAKNLGDRAEITLSNSYPKSASVAVRYLRVRGQPVYDFGQQSVGYEDSASGWDNGWFSKQLDAPLLQDAETARNLAIWAVVSRNVVTGDLEWVEFLSNGSSSLMQHARDRQIGDRVALSETQTGVSNQYFIIGVRQTISNHHNHRVRWILEPVPSTNMWLLGVTGFSELGVTTTLGA